MSRVIQYSKAVDIVHTTSTNALSISGQLGGCTIVLPSFMHIRLCAKQYLNELHLMLTCSTQLPRKVGKRVYSIYNTYCTLVNNIVVGVEQGYLRVIQLKGLGYKCEVLGQTLVMKLGYSHSVEYKIPYGISVACVTPTLLVVSGTDQTQVGHTAAVICRYRRQRAINQPGFIQV